MKNHVLFTSGITALGLALLLVTPVQAEQNRFDLQADMGGTSASDVKLKGFFGQPIAANSEITLDPGVRFGIRGGYGLTDWLAAEIETGVSANDIDTITGTGLTVTEANGSIANVPLLLNLRLQVPEKNRISPYIGAGFGLTSTVLSGDDITINGVRYSGDSADAVFAW
jgi:opacity protein-like surface antigen